MAESGLQPRLPSPLGEMGARTSWLVPPRNAERHDQTFSLPVPPLLHLPEAFLQLEEPNYRENNLGERKLGTFEVVILL